MADTTRVDGAGRANPALPGIVNVNRQLDQAGGTLLNEMKRDSVYGGKRALAEPLAGDRANAAPGIYAAKNTPFTPPPLPSAGIFAPFYRAPGISQIPEYRTNSKLDAFMNRSYSSGLQQGQLSSKYANYDKLRLDPRDFADGSLAGKMVEDITSAIGRFQPVLGFVKENRRHTAGSPMFTLHGIRAFNERLRIYSQERQAELKLAAAAGRPINPAFANAPGSKESVHWFRQNVSFKGILRECYRPEIGKNDPELLAELQSDHFTPNVFGIWGTPTRNLMQGDHVGLRLVTRHPRRELAEMIAQDNGTYWQLTFTPEEIEARYERLEPVIFGPNAELSMEKYNGGSAWCGHTIYIGVSESGTSFKDIQGSVHAFLYGVDQKQANVLTKNIPRIQLYLKRE